LSGWTIDKAGTKCVVAALPNGNRFGEKGGMLHKQYHRVTLNFSRILHIEVAN
jgi:hypothetical protein